VSEGQWIDYATYAGDGEHTVVGNLLVLPGVSGPQPDLTRDILVLLPASYGAADRRYPVIYLQDGQNLFDRAASFAGEWSVDETMAQLGLEAIVVGIPNAGRLRFNEYSPFRDQRLGGGRGDRYLDFLVATIKPRIDADFRTLPECDQTTIGGSSMGALISLYAFFRHPETFGGAMAMSPSFWVAHGAIFQYVRRAAFVPGRIYLDVGSREGGARMLGDARRMRNLLQEKGYRIGERLRYVEEEGAIHHESAWSRRLPAALQFLLQSTSPVEHDASDG
jgi:predicted alpha/beta superfamily hydrolase